MNQLIKRLIYCTVCAILTLGMSFLVANTTPPTCYTDGEINTEKFEPGRPQSCKGKKEDDDCGSKTQTATLGSCGTADKGKMSKKDDSEADVTVSYVSRICNDSEICESSDGTKSIKVKGCLATGNPCGE